MYDTKYLPALADIASWMGRHHLKLNLDKTELLYIPHRASPLPELDGTTVTASRSARNLGLVLDDQLDFKEQVEATPRPCRFLLYDIRRIRQYLTAYSTQLLDQAMPISRLDNCNSLLASLPAYAYTPARPLRSAATGRLVHPASRAPGSRSSRLRSISTLAPWGWSDLLIPIRMAPSLPIFGRSLKTHVFTLYLDSSAGVP